MSNNNSDDENVFEIKRVKLSRITTGFVKIEIAIFLFLRHKAEAREPGAIIVLSVRDQKTERRKERKKRPKKTFLLEEKGGAKKVGYIEQKREIAVGRHAIFDCVVFRVPMVLIMIIIAIVIVIIVIRRHIVKDGVKKRVKLGERESFVEGEKGKTENAREKILPLFLSLS